MDGFMNSFLYIYYSCNSFYSSKPSVLVYLRACFMLIACELMLDLPHSHLMTNWDNFLVQFCLKMFPRTNRGLKSMLLWKWANRNGRPSSQINFHWNNVLFWRIKDQDNLLFWRIKDQGWCFLKKRDCHYSGELQCTNLEEISGG